MTTGNPTWVPPAIQIPELGPALGRIALPAGPGSGPSNSRLLDPIRLELATAIFEQVADARSWSSAGDRHTAVDVLGSAAWLTAWEAAVRATAQKIAADIDDRLVSAAGESRMPRRRLKKLLLNDAEKRAIAARLGRGGFAFAEGMDALEQEGHLIRAAGVHDREAANRWRVALLDTARRLEAAWLILEEAAEEEWLRWNPLITSVRGWHRPRWVLWTISLLVVAVLVYVGLVVGGYVDGPPSLDAFAEWWWTWWDRVVEPA